MKNRAVSIAPWILLAIFLTASTVYPPKLIWTDELAHFAIGAFDRFFDALLAALHAIRYGQSHNQTAVHMMVDWGMLRMFGASAFWMRFPSLVSFAWILLAAGLAFQRWNLPARWKFLGFLALGFNPWLREQAYEARPYLPFAAGMMGTWVFLTADPISRKRAWFRLFGALSLLLASTIHPYFGPYLAVLCLFLFMTRKGGRLQDVFEWKWILASSLLYLFIGKVTWLSREMHFTWDPFQWIGHGFSAVRVFFSAHLQALASMKTVFLAAVVGAFILSFRNPRFRSFRNSEAFHWFALAFFLSLALSLSSYWNGYWILQRQWIASIALANIALPGLGYGMERALERRFPKRLLLLVVGVGILFSATRELKQFTQGLRDGWPHLSDQEAPNVLNEMNRNVDAGGEVWGRFRTYYDWPSPEEGWDWRNKSSVTR